MPDVAKLLAAIEAGEGGALPPLHKRAPVAGPCVPLRLPPPELCPPPLYVVRAVGGWLNLAAYARFLEDHEDDRLLLYHGSEADPLPLVGEDAARVRRHLAALEERAPA